MSSTGNSYNRPPITESVIEIRFKDPLAYGTIERLRDRLSASFPAVEAIKGFSFQLLEPTAEQMQVQSAVEAFKLTDADGTRIVILGLQHITFSRLAPYPGWQAFRDNAKSLWKLHRKAVGPLGVSRIGLRYVNRMDLPLTEKLIQLENFVSVYTQYPEDHLSPPEQFLSQITIPEHNNAPGSMITTASMESPLPGHLGILVDIDVFSTSNVAYTENSLWPKLEAMRIEKNRLFELTITENARKLFYRE